MTSFSALQSIVNFLKAHPPFSFIAIEDLYSLAEEVELVFFAQNESIFRMNQPPNAYFYIVKKGAIRLTQEQDNIAVLVDECATGDVFGVRAIFAEDTYLSSATAAEDSLVYKVDVEKAKKIVQDNSRVAMYFASIFASGLSMHKDEERKARRFLVQKEDWFFNSAGIDTIQIQPQKAVITCLLEKSIQYGATLMTRHKVGSLVLVNEQGHPAGIVTDTDLRKKVIAKGQSSDLPLLTVMSSPVLTIGLGYSLLEVLLIMTAHKVSHLCITEDGSTQSKVIGIISQRDVLLLQGNNPAVIAKHIQQSEDIDLIRHLRDQAEKLVHSYLYQELAIPLISNIITEINDTLIEKAVHLAQAKLTDKGLPPPDVKFCWLTLGSEGRKEQLLRTDQDNALVYEDTHDEEKAVAHRDYFLQMTKEVTRLLVHWGFVECAADIMASNPTWCQPLSQWENYFEEWISFPDEKAVMNMTIFFDFRPIAGEFALADRLKQYIFDSIQRNSAFLSYLAKNALQNLPPLSFFSNFIVEKNGEHKDLFDIKARAMMPLADAARIFMLEFNLPIYGSTFERFEAVSKLEENLKDICTSAALAYEIFIKHRALTGFNEDNDGRYINPKDLNKLEKQILKNAFETITKLQKILEVRYQVNYLQ
ncbi:MAG: DUF294 nucleotidyltransferase-like domain-containing protein [Thermonemataceae bacterium]